jgi:hypothetical protein
METAQRANFWLMIALLVAAVWWCGVFPSQDGPAHAYNAALLRAPLGGTYELQTGLTTNWTAHLLLIPLLSALSPESADKAVVTLALLVCAAGAFACLRRAAWLLPFALPLFFNGLLFAGFYSFVFGVGFLLLVAGGARPRWLWLALCWVSHPFCWAAAVAVAAVEDWPRWRRLLLEASPGLACAVPFVIRGSGGGMVGPPLPAGHFSEFLFGENPFAVVHAGYAAAACALMAGVAGMALWAWRHGGTRDGLLLLAGLCWVAWPLAPKQTMTGNLVPRRVLLCALIFTLLWVSRQEWGQRFRQLAWAAGAALAASMALVAAWQMAAVQPLLEEYRGLRVAGTTLALRYRLQADVMRGVDVFAHAADWMILRDGALDADNYEARTAHFPLRYRHAPVEGVVNPSAAPPSVQLRETSLPDCVVLWGYPAEDPLRRRLERDFVLAQRSAPQGLGEVWKRRAVSASR